MNLLPFVVELREGEAIRDFLCRVQRELADAHDHTTYTLANLLEDIRPDAPAIGASPIPVGLTSVKKLRSHELPQSGFLVDYVANPKSFESFEWYLNAVEDGDRLLLTCHYNNGLFDEATVKEWLAALDALFREIVLDSREAGEIALLNIGGKSHAAKVRHMPFPQGATGHQPGSVAPPVRQLFPGRRLFLRRFRC